MTMELFTIKDVWLKKFGKLQRRMEKIWPINLQIKDNAVHKNKTRNLVCGRTWQEQTIQF